MIPQGTQIRENSTKYGVGAIITGLVLLIGLRLWVSPIIRRVSGRGGISMFEFLLIPVFLGLVAIGVLLFLWEPERT